jgi:hypothetical protein
MNDLLRERNLDTVVIEGFLYFARHITFYGPIILLFYPGTYDKINTGIRELRNSDLGGRFREYPVILPQ